MLGIPVMGGGIIGVQLKGPPEFLFGCLPVPVIILDDQSQRRMGLSQVPIKLNRTPRRVARLRHKIRLRTLTVTAYQCIAVRQAGVSARVGGVLCRGLFEIVDSLQEPRDASLVKEVLTLEIEIITFVTRGSGGRRLRGRLVPRLTTKGQMNLIRHFSGDLALQ